MSHLQLYVCIIVALNFLTLISHAAGENYRETPFIKQSHEIWEHSNKHLLTLTVGNRPVSDLLGNVLKHNYSLPKAQVRRGLTYYGSAHRLRHVLHRAMTQTTPLKLGVVGGSVCWGHGASKRGVTDWFSLVTAWMASSFPRANVTGKNGCVPGTQCSYMVMCMELSVEPDVDVVFVDYALNDGIVDKIAGNDKVQTYERLIRRLLALPNKPAVVLVQVPSHGMATDVGHVEYRPFYVALEDLYDSVAEYYDLQSLSFRTGLYRLATFLKKPGFRWSYMMDHIHFADPGQRYMADMAIWLLQSTALDLVLRPWDKEDEQQMAEELPEPMYAGNLPPKTSLCLHQDAMKSVVVGHEGWEFVNEGTPEKPKKGYVTNEVGKPLKLSLNTLRPHDTTGVNSPVPVFIAYLKSYTNMGKARFECIQGCACEAKVYDAHHELKESQLYTTQVLASQAEACVMTVTVLNDTSSGSHKFKVAGVMMSDVTAANPNPTSAMEEGKWGTSHFHEGQGARRSRQRHLAAGAAAHGPPAHALLATAAQALLPPDSFFEREALETDDPQLDALL